MAQGVVKWFDPSKGFGFIAPDGGGSDVFVHISALEAARIRTFDEGQKVEYELTMHKGKMAAINLSIL